MIKRKKNTPLVKKLFSYERKYVRYITRRGKKKKKKCKKTAAVTRKNCVIFLHYKECAIDAEDGDLKKSARERAKTAKGEKI